MAKPSSKPAPTPAPSTTLKPTAALIKNVWNAPLKSVLADDAKPGLDPVQKANWSQIDEFADSIANNIALMAESINETVTMVRQLGCEHIKEFDVVVKKTNDDFTRFIEDFKAIRVSHATKTGPVDNPDDHALYLSVYERYTQFYALFTGVFHHTQVSFTEYALEAKDNWQKLQAAQSVAAPEAPVEATQDTTVTEVPSVEQKAE